MNTREQLAHNPNQQSHKSNYRSVISQTLHYMSRPHSSIAMQPIVSEAAWKGPQLLKSDKFWQDPLNEADIAELDAALAHAKGLNKPTGSMSKDDFPLPTLSKKIARWRQALKSGRGFQVISGIPVERWGREDSEIFFWCFGLHLGIPGAQNEDGDLLGHVRDLNAPVDDTDTRLYKTNANIEYHCDAADVVGLLCLNKAKSGGKSRIVSSVAVYNEILKRRPDLIPVLYRPMLVDTFGEGSVNYFPVVPCRYHNGELKTFYHIDYFRSTRRYDEVRPFTPQEEELLNLYQEVASDPEFYLDMDLQPGDIQLLSNHTNLHARTDYIDYEDSDKKRHLLRLWTSLPHEHDIHSKWLTFKDKVQLVSGIVKEKVKFKFRSA